MITLALRWFAYLAAVEITALAILALAAWLSDDPEPDETWTVADDALVEAWLGGGE